MSTLITAEIAKQVAQIVADHHTGVAAAIWGKDAVSPEDWKTAVDLGMVDPTATGTTIGQQLYTYGIYMTHVDQA